MKRNDVFCRGCRNAEITMQTLPTCKAASNYANVFREIVIYCRRKKCVIKYPYEQCKLKEETPPLRIDQFLV